jgi:NADPH:quinone reductase-like Zn-dependent oxidoreductase
MTKDDHVPTTLYSNNSASSEPKGTQSTTKTIKSGKTKAPGKTMRAIVQRSYGSAEVLKLETLDIPPIGPKEVLIEVHCAALDRGTWHLMTGTPYLIRMLGFGLLRPKQLTPGLDVAGRVIEIGSHVTRFSPGDEVFGIANGSFAEYTVASEDKLVAKPADMTYEIAAAAPISGTTALEALTDVGQLQAGQKVLIVGASGGVGTYTVQLAKALGAEVTGVASASKANLLRSLGADHIVDYQTDYLANSECHYDLIIDIGGRNKVSRLRRVLTPEGTLVFVGGEGGNHFTGGIGRQVWASLMSIFLKQRLTMFIAGESHLTIERLSGFIQSGEVQPSIGTRYSLDDVPAAMNAIEVGNVRGKAVIMVRP